MRKESKNTNETNGFQLKFHSLPMSKQYDRNLEIYGNNQNTCVCCGRPTAEKLSVHMEASQYMATNVDDEIILEASGKYQTQGFHAIGPECAKKLPKEFVFGWPDLAIHVAETILITNPK